MRNVKSTLSIIATVLAFGSAPAFALTDDHGDIHKQSELQEIATAKAASEGVQGRKASNVRATEGQAGETNARSNKRTSFGEDFLAGKVSAP